MKECVRKKGLGMKNGCNEGKEWVELIMRKRLE